MLILNVFVEEWQKSLSYACTKWFLCYDSQSFWGTWVQVTLLFGWECYGRIL